MKRSAQVGRFFVALKVSFKTIEASGVRSLVRLNGAYRIVMRGVQKMHTGCSSLRCRNALSLQRLNYDTATDPFGGSGSTLIACEQLGRICHTIELDEKYCDVIVKRYIEQVGSADTVSVIRDGKTIRFEDLEVSGDGK